MRTRIRRLLTDLGYVRARNLKDQPREVPGLARVKYAGGRCYVRRGGRWVEIDMPHTRGEC